MEKDSKDDKMNDILYHAHRCLYFNNLLIEQCDSWLSEEEGNENMMKAIMERRKKETQNQLKNNH